MARSLSSPQLAALQVNPFQSEYLIELYTGSGTNYYFTTGFSDVQKDTQGAPISTIQTFVANNQISVISELRESYDPNGNELTIEWSTTDTTLAATLNVKFLKTKVTLQKLFRDATTNAVTSAFVMYDGNVTQLAVQGGQNEQIIQLKCQSVFRNLDNVKGRTTTDIEPYDARTITWGTIVWR